MKKTLLKWAGNKSKIMPEIVKSFPKEYSCYIEPFAGALGSFLNADIPHEKDVILSDLNSEIISFFIQVRDNPSDVSKLANSWKKDKEAYYEIRSWDKKEDWSTIDSLTKAARTVYLNKLCFNGLYRVNEKKGHFNVPYAGGRKSEVLPLSDALNFSNRVKNVTFKNEDYKAVCQSIPDNSLLYFDPPYVDIKNPAKTFGGYVNGFDLAEQRRLVELGLMLREQGHSVVISNSFCDATIDLYKDYNVRIIEATRHIAAKSSSRGKIKEIVATLC